MVAQAGIRNDDETIEAIHDNPVNTLPRWLKINLFVSRITVCCMVVLGGPAIIAFGIMTRNDLRNEFVLLYLLYPSISPPLSKD